jgi:hypothetical protein
LLSKNQNQRLELKESPDKGVYVKVSCFESKILLAILASAEFVPQAFLYHGAFVF